MSDEPDLIREALQVRINEGGSGPGREGYVVAHYVAIVGLVGAVGDGGVETGVVVLEQNGQASYITNGLLGQAPEVLAEFTETVEADSEDDDA